MEKEKCTCKKCSNYDTRKEQLKEKYNKLINDEDSDFFILICDKYTNSGVLYSQGMSKLNIITGLNETTSQMFEEEFKNIPSKEMFGAIFK